MALTPEEQRELKQLEAELSGGLTPAEQKELSQLEAELGNEFTVKTPRRMSSGGETVVTYQNQPKRIEPRGGFGVLRGERVRDVEVQPPPKQTSKRTFIPDVIQKPIFEPQEPDVPGQIKQIGTAPVPNVFNPASEVVEERAREVAKSAVSGLDALAMLANLVPGVNLPIPGEAILSEPEEERGGVRRFVEDVGFGLPVDVGTAAIARQGIKKVSKRFAKPIQEFGQPVQEVVASNELKVPGKFRDKLDNVITELSDNTQPIKRAMRILGVDSSEVLSNPVEVIKKNRAANGALAGKIRLDVMPILNKVDDYGAFRDYVTAKSAQDRLKILKRKGKGAEFLGRTESGEQITEEWIKNTIKLNDSSSFRQAQREWVKADHQGIKDLLDSGMLSRKEAAQMFKAHRNHVPFNRVLEEEGLEGFKEVAGMASKGPMKFKGSTKKLQDPIVSTIKMRIAYNRVAKHNENIKSFVDFVKDVPGSEKFIKRASVKTKPKQLTVDGLEEATEDAVLKEDAFGFKARLGPRERAVYRDGKREIWEFTKEGESIMQLLDQELAGSDSLPFWAMATFGTSTKLLKAGATTFNVAFIPKNAFRDYVIRGIQTKGSVLKAMNPGAYAKAYGEQLLELVPDRFLSKSFKDRFNKNYRDFVREGGPFSNFILEDKDAIAKELAKITGDGTYYFKRSTDGLTDIISMVETAPRYLEYKTVLKNELTRGTPANEAKARALRASQEVTLNFLTSGNLVKKGNKVIPFLNAGVRDLSKIGEVYAKHPGRTTAAVGALVTAPSLALYVQNSEDPDYQALPEWEKDLYWHIRKDKVPFIKEGFMQSVQKGPFIRIPRPFGHGFIGGRSVELAMDNVLQKDPEAHRNFLNAMKRSIAPNALSEDLGIPFVSMLLLAAADYDSFKGGQFTSQAEKRLPAALRRRTQTSPTLAFVSEILREKNVGMNPRKTQRLLEQQFAGVGKQALGLIDAGFRATFADEERAEDTLAKNLAVKLKRFDRKSLVDYSKLNEFFDYSALGLQADNALGLAEKTGQFEARREARIGKKQRELSAFVNEKKVRSTVKRLMDAIKIKSERGDPDLEIRELEQKLNSVLTNFNARARSILGLKRSPVFGVSR